MTHFRGPGITAVPSERRHCGLHRRAPDAFPPEMVWAQLAFFDVSDGNEEFYELHRTKDYPDRDRLALRFERFKAAA